MHGYYMDPIWCLFFTITIRTFKMFFSAKDMFLAQQRQVCLSWTQQKMWPSLVDWTCHEPKIWPMSFNEHFHFWCLCSFFFVYDFPMIIPHPQEKKRHQRLQPRNLLLPMHNISPMLSWRATTLKNPWRPLVWSFFFFWLGVKLEEKKAGWR